LHGGSLRRGGVVLRFKFHRNQLSGFRDLGEVEIWSFSITLAVGLYNSLYYRESRLHFLALCRERIPFTVRSPIWR